MVSHNTVHLIRQVSKTYTLYIFTRVLYMMSHIDIQFNVSSADESETVSVGKSFDDPLESVSGQNPVTRSLKS